MYMFTTKEEYSAYFREVIKRSKRETDLEDYLSSQWQRLDQLTEQLSEKTFWPLFPEILGIDARLALVTELLEYDDFSTEELIRITETDYRYYLKELCGFDLSGETKPLMVFNVL
ncbi:hypothetical protein D922_02694 [Enterococcus faecalis 06-MB-DW-09]|nr:hypothetical protein D922_02694 [Enterococcus faecalis 06-MB-DW-09]